MLKSILGRSKQTSSQSSLAEEASNEPQQIQEAMDSMGHLMNGDIEQAEKSLQTGKSPFHQLSKSTVSFMRATMGLEQEVLKEVFEKLAETEEVASTQQKKMQKSKTTQSDIFPPGTEYALVTAQAQLMGAFVAVLSESLSESMKGFLKLRRAFITLESIVSAERDYASGTKPAASSIRNSEDSSRSPSQPASEASGDVSAATSPPTSTPNASMNQLAINEGKTPGAESDFEFFDATTPGNEREIHSFYEGHLTDVDVPGIEVEPPPPDLAEATRRISNLDGDTLLSHTATTNTIDAFIHSGTCLCFGVLLLMFSLIPPALAPLLKIVGFRGDRARGLSLLWRATHLDNVNSAFAGLVLLSYYHDILGFADITPPVSAGGMPKERCRTLLDDMRTRYPRSDLWRLLDAQRLSSDRNIPASLERSAAPASASFRQVEALRVFHRSLMQMFTHAYNPCAAGFMKCVSLNNWSHGVYFYIAGACNVQLSRQLQDDDPTEAMEHGGTAEDHFAEVPKLAGKKRLLARPMPFDVFVTRKIAKWQARAKEKNCGVAEAVRGSPIDEMIYFWGGFRRMGPVDLEKSLANLRKCEQEDEWTKEDEDEKAAVSVLQSVALRMLGWMPEAKALLEKLVAMDPSKFKGGNRENWVPPVARYELAVCLWEESQALISEAAEKDTDAGSVTMAVTELVQRCSALLDEAAKWESYDLDTRVGLKVSTARTAIKLLHSS